MKKSFCRKTNYSRVARGFSLIELMTVVAVLAILTAIAYPSYTNYIVKTRRTAAKACMTQISNYMERYYTTNMNYTAAVDPKLDCESTAQTGNFYSWTVTPGAAAYTITAAPTAQQPDTTCGTLTLNQAGTRTPATTGCW